MRMRLFTISLLFIAQGALAAPPCDAGCQALNLLYSAGNLGVNAGNRYDGIVQQGIQNSKATGTGSTVDKAVNGSMIGSSEADATLQASKPYFSNTPVPGSAAGQFWDQAANGTQQQFDQTVSTLSATQLEQMAKAAPDGADTVARDYGKKAQQAADNAAEGVAGETARFWGLIEDSISQSKSDIAAAQNGGGGTSGCYDAACRFSSAGWAIWQKAMDVGSAITEFAETRDYNASFASVTKQEDPPVTGGSSGGTTQLADNTKTGSDNGEAGNAIPQVVKEALEMSGLNPIDLQNRIAAGDTSAYSDIAGAIDQSGDAQGAADAVKDFASNSDTAGTGADNSGADKSLAAAGAPPPLSADLQARMGAPLPGAKAPSRNASTAASAVVEALRRNYLRKHGNKGDEDAAALSIQMAARAARAKGANGGQDLSDATLFDLQRMGVQKRRDRANIFQVARLTYHKQADARAVRRLHASRKAEPNRLLLAGAMAQ